MAFSQSWNKSIFKDAWLHLIFFLYIPVTFAKICLSLSRVINYEEESRAKLAFVLAGGNAEQCHCYPSLSPKIFRKTKALKEISVGTFLFLFLFWSSAGENIRR